MARNIITALDVGTSTVQTVVAEKKKGEGGLKILGMGVASSSGLRRGLVVDLGEAASAIMKSVDEARRSAGVPIRSVWLSVGGAQAFVSSSRGVVAVSRADGEITREDINRSIAAAETFITKNPNREILHIIPRDFRVDNEAGIKDPVGMHGIRLEVDALIIECSAPLLKNLLKCVEAVGLDVEDYVFSPLAAAETVLTKRQKELGVMLLDVGGGTSSFIVFEEGAPIHAGVIPIGGGHITNDIAIGLRTHVDVAEEIKTAHGSSLPDEVAKRDNIRLADFVEGEEAVYSRRALAEIIEARLQDLYELLQKELRKIDRAQLLPSGIVLIGGSALIPGIRELTRRHMKLPVEFGLPQHFAELLDEKSALPLSTILGVLQWAYGRTFVAQDSGWNARMVRVGRSGFGRWLRSLLP